ncbi:hypothetical protein ACQP2U_43385 (plasmid) [Nocardia sp. CA-084685]|uniref:hypothetical protein n=1 Tax=Nocardia sp. CA-084685 TaxID=3239970 RepID=UPI003D98E82E
MTATVTHTDAASAPSAQTAFRRFRALLNGGEFDALTSKGGSLDGFTTTKADTRLIRVTTLRVVSRVTDPGTGVQRLAPLDWAVQTDLRENADGTVVEIEDSRAVIAFPLEPGHQDPYYRARKRGIKAARLVQDLLSTDPSRTPSKTTEAHIKASAARLGIRRPPSHATCVLVKTILHLAFMSGTQRAPKRDTP